MNLDDILICEDAKLFDSIELYTEIHVSKCDVDSLVFDKNEYCNVLLINTTNINKYKVRNTILSGTKYAKISHKLYAASGCRKYGELTCRAAKYLFLYSKNGKIKVSSNLIDVYHDKTGAFSKRFKCIYDRMMLLDDYTDLGLKISNYLILAHPVFSGDSMQLPEYFRLCGCEKTEENVELFHKLAKKLGFTSTNFGINLGKMSLDTYII